MTPVIVSPRDRAASIGAQSPAVLARTYEDAFPRLYDLDRDAYNAPFSGADAAAVGAEYARRWAAVVGREVVASVLERHEPGFDGNIPRNVDSELLHFGSDHGLDTYAQAKKFALRRGFWTGNQQAASPG